MKTNRPWILRPVAWVLTCLMALVLNFIAELVCKLGFHGTTILSNFNIVLAIILAVTSGVAFIALFIYLGIVLPQLLVTVSDQIYPSFKAFRYYFVALCLVAICTILIAAGLTGGIAMRSVFWYYARYVWLIFASYNMVKTGRSFAQLHRANMGG